MVSLGGKWVSEAFGDSWAGLIVGVGYCSNCPQGNWYPGAGADPQSRWGS